MIELQMMGRPVIFLMVFAVGLARLCVCPAEVAAPKQHAEHSCCEKSDKPATPVQSKSHESTCPHCGVTIAPADKTAEVSSHALVTLDALPTFTGFITQTTAAPHEDVRLHDPSPPSLMALHCTFLI